MPKGKKQVVTISPTAQFALVDGATFVRLQAAARLAGIHPVILEMGAQLIKRIGNGGAGAAFQLETADLERNAAAITSMFKTGLRRYAKAIEPQKKIKVKSVRDGKRLVFWYA